MKVVGHEMGRVIMLFPIDEIRPREGFYLLNAMQAMQQRYGFVKLPDFSRPLEELDRDGYKFGHGRLEVNGKTAVIAECGIYSDGLSITCFDTEYADKFLDDLLDWSRSALGRQDFVREPRRLYRSQIVVEFEKKLSGLFTNFSLIAEIINDAMNRVSAHPQAVDVARIAFGKDPSKIAGLAPVPFTFERKIGTSYEFERYFSEASLPTQSHIGVLQKIESIAASH